MVGINQKYDLLICKNKEDVLHWDLLSSQPNKIGLFEGIFSLGGQFDPPFIFQEELI